jgi:hypothetical protein
LTILPVLTATAAGIVPVPPDNTTTFLRGDGTFAVPPVSTGPFTSKFTSTGNAVPVTAVLSVAHGLGVVPFGIQVTLVNVTSNLGYTAGQEVELSTATQEVNSYTIALYKDVTSVYLGTSDIIYIPTASGGAAVPITAADWTVTVRAWI